MDRYGFFIKECMIDMFRIYDWFCKVQFLCYDGEPNWLGWLILGPMLLIGLWFLIGITSSVFGFIGFIIQGVEKIIGRLFNEIMKFFRK